jgi:hypothetical protein
VSDLLDPPDPYHRSFRATVVDAERVRLEVVDA